MPGRIKSPFAGFRLHDLRHQAVTELAESTASDFPSCRKSLNHWWS